MERSLVLVKPDGVKRGLVGEIIHRFERAGLKLVGMKMVWVDEDLVDKHYPNARDEFIRGMGQKTLDNYKELGIDPMEHAGTEDPHKIGLMINVWNKELLTSGPVVAMVLEGNHAITNIRRIVGPTLPSMAAPGTIRGDLALDSSALANEKKRAIKNLIHASGNKDEAELEIGLWFKDHELHTYKRADEEAMY
jgi:nucleoside-diphosphate kinase